MSNPTLDCFSLKTANRLSKTGARIDDIEPIDPDDADDEAEEEEKIQRLLDRSGGYTLGDMEESKKSGAADTERELDMWYSIYAAKAKKDSHGIAMEETKERKRQTKRRALREAAAARAMEVDKDGENAEDETETRQLELNSDASTSSDEADMGEEVDLGKDPMSARDAALWFSQPMFANSAALLSDEERQDDSSEDEADSEDGKAVEEDTHRAARREARLKAEKTAAKIQEGKEEDGFEIVPNEAKSKAVYDDDDEEETAAAEKDDGEESDSSFHSSDYDSDEKAEMVAIGKKMRGSKRDATEILDDAYNRYTFDDPIDLPRWFADRDPEYRVRREPVTKEQVTEMKAYIKSLQAAPTKKEAEAKARKKARIEKRLDAVKAKANTIAEQTEVSASARMKAIENLYKTASKSSAKGSKNKPKQYQVVRPGGVRQNVGKGKAPRGRKGARVTLVDKRLKSDKRGIKKAQEGARKAQKRRNARQNMKRG